MLWLNTFWNLDLDYYYYHYIIDIGGLIRNTWLQTNNIARLVLEYFSVLMTQRDSVRQSLPSQATTTAPPGEKKAVRSCDIIIYCEILCVGTQFSVSTPQPLQQWSASFGYFLQDRFRDKYFCLFCVSRRSFVWPPPGWRWFQIMNLMP